MNANLVLTVPPGWSLVPAEDLDGGLGRFVDAIEWPDDRDRERMRAYLDTISDVLRLAGVDALAAMVLLDEDGGLVQASCAVTTVPYDAISLDALESLAAASPFGPGETALSPFTTPLGSGTRATRFRAGRLFTDKSGHWPYVYEVRYALPVAEGVAAVMHCETMSVAYHEELDDVFDAIASRLTVTASGEPGD